MPRLFHPALRRHLLALTAIGLFALGASPTATGQARPPQAGSTGVQAGSTGIDASGDYRQEMQACMQGRTAQDRATCMEEARNARAAGRRGALDTPSPLSMEANAMARCRDLSPADMAACQARMMGHGRTSGSVAGGGILRELEVVEMQPGQETVTVSPKGDAPVLVVPAQGK